MASSLNTLRIEPDALLLDVTLISRPMSLSRMMILALWRTRTSSGQWVTSTIVMIRPGLPRLCGVGWKRLELWLILLGYVVIRFTDAWKGSRIPRRQLFRTEDLMVLYLLGSGASRIFGYVVALGSKYSWKSTNMAMSGPIYIWLTQEQKRYCRASAWTAVDYCSERYGWH